MNVWKMIAHHTDRESATDWIRKYESVAIGWGLIGDIKNFRSPDDVKTAIKRTYAVPPYKNNAHLGAPSLWDFCFSVQPKDLIIVKGGDSGSLVVRLVGEYRHMTGESPLYGDFQNQRRVEVTRLDWKRIFLLAGEAPKTHRYQTLVKCARPLNENQL